MRRWILLSATLMLIALTLLFTSVYTTQAQEPRPPQPAAATPRPMLPLPVRPDPLPIGGQTIGGPGVVRGDVGVAYPVFTNRGRDALDVSITVQNDGASDLYLEAFNPLSASAPILSVGPIKPGTGQAAAVSLPTMFVAQVVCRNASDVRCAFQWRVDRVR